MRIPRQTGAVIRFHGATAERVAVSASQTISIEPDLPVPPIRVDCGYLYTRCKLGCSVRYYLCLRSGESRQKCKNEYFPCSDACDDAYFACRGMPRDPNYDPYGDHFGGLAVIS